MGYEDSEYDEILKEAWERFCDDLKRAGKGCFQGVARTTPAERAEAFRYLPRASRSGSSSSSRTRTRCSHI